MDDLVSFFQNMATLIQSGMPLLHSLRLCGEQNESQKLSNVIADMANKIAAGASLHQAISENKKIFKPHWIHMIRTGEITGQLGSLMSALSVYIIQVKKSQSKVKSAMVYPSILLSVAIGALFIMLGKVVPTFADFFKDFGSELPPITEFVIKMSNIVQQKGLYVVGGVAVFAFLFRMWKKTESGKRIFDETLLALPLVGPLIVQSCMERFATNLAIMLKAGTPLLEALRTIQDIYYDNSVYRDAVASVYASVSRGNSMARSLDETGLFTNMVVSMAKTGEESGKLPQVMETVAGYYQEKVSTLVDRVTGVLEPAIVIGMGVVVCGLLASVYIPMFQMAGGPGGK